MSTMDNSFSSISRRTFLTLAGVGAGLATFGSFGRYPSAFGSNQTPSWRQGVIDEAFGGDSDFTTRSLQQGLEVWELQSRSAFAIVDTASEDLLEYDSEMASPFRGLDGEGVYLGPGEYYRLDSDTATNLITVEEDNPQHVREDGRIFAEDLRHQLVKPPPPSTDPISPFLDPLKPGDVKKRVTNYSYITGSYVYHNNSGICGWVAGSILMRYWHARSSARKLIPSKYLQGTNFKPTTSNAKGLNFSAYLRDGRKADTWAKDLKEQFAWNGNKQKVKFTTSYVVGNIGIANEINNDRPVVVFGKFPTSKKSKGMHAVVAYGITKSGRMICHYGWKDGYTKRVINSGLVGSNTKFRLT